MTSSSIKWSMCHWCVMLTLMYNVDKTQKKQKIAFFHLFRAFFFSFFFSIFSSAITRRQNLQRLTKTIRNEKVVIFTFCELCVAIKKFALWIRKANLINVFFARSKFASFLIAMSEWIKIDSSRSYRRRKCSNRSNKK